MVNLHGLVRVSLNLQPASWLPNKVSSRNLESLASQAAWFRSGKTGFDRVGKLAWVRKGKVGFDRVSVHGFDRVSLHGFDWASLYVFVRISLNGQLAWVRSGKPGFDWARLHGFDRLSLVSIGSACMGSFG